MRPVRLIVPQSAPLSQDFVRPMTRKPSSLLGGGSLGIACTLSGNTSDAEHFLLNCRLKNPYLEIREKNIHEATE